MNGHAQGLRRPAGAVAAVAITAGLVLAGCGGSTSPSGSSGSSGSAGSGSSSGPGSSSSASSSSSSSTSVVSSATVPFPVGVGDTWTYKTTYGQTVNKMTAVTPVSSGQQVTMATTSTADGTTTDNTAYYVVDSDGSISLPFSQFNTSSSGASVKLISGSIFWPPAAELASGKAYHSTLRIEYSVAGKRQKVDAHITVQGAGTQSVTVPAGTYSATVVDMTMSETIDGMAVGDEVKTWLATGVGPVQTEVIVDEAGTDHALAEDKLVSYKAG
jgi:hypothetical protein